MKTKIQLVPQAVSYYFGSSLSAFLSFLASVYIARILGPELKGIYTLATLIPTTLLIFGDFGLCLANTYFASSRKASPEKLSASSLLHSIFIGMTLLLTMLFAYQIPTFKNFLKIPDLYFYLGLCSLPILLYITFMGALYRGLGKINYVNEINITRTGTLLIFVLLFCKVFKLNISGALAAWLISVLLSGALAFLLTTKNFAQPIWTVLRSYSLKFSLDQLYFGIKGYFANIFTFFSYRFDMFLVNYFLDSTQLGLYSISVLFAEILWLGPTAVGFVHFPKTAAISAESNELATKLTPRVARTTLFFTLVSATLFSLFTHLFIPFFLPKYTHSLTVFLYLLPGIVIFSVDKVLSNDLLGRGKPIYSTISAGVMLGVNVVADLFLIPRYKIVGAGLASTIAYTVGTVLTIFFFKKETKVSIKSVLIIELADLKEAKRSLGTILKKLKGVRHAGKGYEGYLTSSKWFSELENKPRHYYLDFRNDAFKLKLFDTSGIPLINYGKKIGLQYNYITIAQYALGTYELYCDTHDIKYLDKFLSLANWLVEKNINGSWRFSFPLELYGLKSGWISALSQGQCISVLVRAYIETKDTKYLEIARQALLYLTLPIEDGGCCYSDEEGNLFLEEFASLEAEPSFVLNGFIFAILGIYDYYRCTYDETANVLFEKCVRSLAKKLPAYDTGFWSLYNLRDRKLASPFYHQLHIDLLKIIYRITNTSIFMEFATKWEIYKKSSLKRWRTFLVRFFEKLTGR